MIFKLIRKEMCRLLGYMFVEVLRFSNGNTYLILNKFWEAMQGYLSSAGKLSAGVRTWQLTKANMNS